jgi:hypothetical protein
MAMNLTTIKSTFEAIRNINDPELIINWAYTYGSVLIEEIERLRRALKVKRLSNFERARDIIKNLARQFETNQWPESEIEIVDQIILASKLMEKDFDGGDYSG